MKYIALALAAALAAASTLVSAAPTKRGFFPQDGPAFIGQLLSKPDEIKLGENFTISYDSNDPSPDPQYPSSILSFDVGIQGPAPIYYSSAFTPSGILELANDLPGQQVVNASLKMSSSADPGEYFLIFTEHQLGVYDPEQPVYRVQSYNVSVQVVQ
ncbi:hypothetical protein JCM3775_000972 [Rhodotorula graminis]|uniref:Uncharacterized protein n=1 Tax=Rhodotorula graminis (strain WP1) TaxID=578459 RepID=A0A194SDJ5_RHOGW|nr:uncharacterized protein RHOBADRAFT_65933 [Rhodotorula graminis WP1]KPV78520.1 hypothetical protein RHOBADRAFT_65933 [Rhodotorula graminis WP1]